MLVCGVVFEAFRVCGRGCGVFPHRRAREAIPPSAKVFVHLLTLIKQLSDEMIQNTLWDSKTT